MEQAKEIETLHWKTDTFELSEELKDGSKVIVYGADKKGRRVYHWLKRTGKYKVAGFVDKRWRKLRGIEEELMSPESIFEKDFDSILISIGSQQTVQLVQEWLEQHGVAAGKIIQVL